MKTKIISLFIISLFLISLVPGAVVGANNSTSQDQEPEKKSAPVMKIDEITTLEDWSYDEENNQFILNITSELRQTIVFSDVFSGIDSDGSGAVSRIPQQEMVLSQGTETITFQVTEYRGKAVLGLATPRASINIVSEGGSGLFSGDPGWSDVQASAIAGLFMGGVIPVGYAFVKKYKEPDEPKRLF